MNGWNCWKRFERLFRSVSEEFLHLPHRLLNSNDDGASDDAVADIQFVHVVDRGDAGVGLVLEYDGDLFAYSTIDSYLEMLDRLALPIAAAP